MKNGGAIVILVVVAAAALGVGAKSLQDEIKAYLNKTEVATYQVVEVDQQRFVVVEVDGAARLVFDVQAELVTNASRLEEVLTEYYRKVESGSFTFRTAEELNKSFASSYAAFQKCNNTFVEFVENNYIWRDYKCWEPGVGKACESATALRKASSSGMTELKPLVEALPALMRKGDTEGTFEALRKTLLAANATYQNASAFNPYYRYFFGKYMQDDADCGFDAEDLKTIVGEISPVIQAQYVGQGTDAAALAQEASMRKEYSRVRGLQVKGEEAVEALKQAVAQAKARSSGYGFPTEGLDAKIAKAERILADLDAASTAAEAEKQLNSLYGAVAETNALKERHALLLPAYSEMLSNVRQADALISEARVSNAGAVDALEKELDEVRSQIIATNEALRKGEEVDAAQVEKLNARAAALKAKASGDASAQFDWFPVTAVFVIALGGFAVYWFKVRRRGYY